MTIDDKTRTELEAAVFRRLVQHLRSHTEVQNIDLMNLAGFCRNCLSNWLKEEADAKGTAMSKDESREAVYGMPYEAWKEKFQATATPEQLAASVTEKLRKFIADPHVTVVVATINSKRIYLVGEVLRPGAATMLPNMTVLQALASAGINQYAKT